MGRTSKKFAEATKAEAKSATLQTKIIDVEVPLTIYDFKRVMDKLCNLSVKEMPDMDLSNAVTTNLLYKWLDLQHRLACDREGGNFLDKEMKATPFSDIQGVLLRGLRKVLDSEGHKISEDLKSELQLFIMNPPIIIKQVAVEINATPDIGPEIPVVSAPEAKLAA